MRPTRAALQRDPSALPWLVRPARPRPRHAAGARAMVSGLAALVLATLLLSVGGRASAATAPTLLIADHRNFRLLITDLDGNLKWKWDNPTGRTSGSRGPLGVRWMGNNQAIVTFGTGEVGLIDVIGKKWIWKVSGFNGDWFQSPYDAEILPDGNLAVATRFNEGGRITVYKLSTGEVVWKHLISNAHSVHYLTAEQSFDHTYPTLLVGGWGAIREVAYRPGGGQNVTWSAKTEYTHDAILVETDKILTVEGYYIQKIDKNANQIWKKMTPDEDRRIALNPNGGYIYTVAEGNLVEFRDVNGNLTRSWGAISDGSHLNYPYGVALTDFTGSGPSPTPTPTVTPTPSPGTTLFSDGFESGSFSAWTTVASQGGGSASVQTSVRKTGTYAALFASDGSGSGYAYARKSLGSARTTLTASGDFDVLQEGPSGGNVPFIRLFTSSGTRLLSVYRQNQASNKIYVSFAGTYNLTSGTLPLNTWGRVSVKVVVNGLASTVEVSLNGVVVYRTTSASLGTAGVLSVQVGNDTASQIYRVAADNILVTS